MCLPDTFSYLMIRTMNLISTSRPKYFIHSSMAGGMAALAFPRASDPCSLLPNRPESQATYRAPPAMVTLVASLRITEQIKKGHKHVKLSENTTAHVSTTVHHYMLSSGADK